MNYKITTLNLLNFAPPHFSFYHENNHYDSQQWIEKTLFIEGLIEHIDSTVIVFQEVFSIEELKTICLQCGFLYFATVDKPKADPYQPTLLLSPVLAIASKLPLENVEALQPSTEILEYLNANPTFNFSRVPIKCNINFTLLGSVCFYVLHLKSKRPNPMTGLEPNDTKATPLIRHLENSIGSTQTMVTRSIETALIYFDVIKTQTQNKNPVIVLGDFNDILNTPSISNFTHAKSNSLQFEAFGLSDSYLMADNTYNHSQRPATHFYNGEGSVLDYILLSKEFSPNLIDSSVSSIIYTCYNKHLSRFRSNEDLKFTDHAAISIEIKL